MKKTFDIALKDMTQHFRSLFALVMMFIVPLLLTGMFYVMFGGSGDEEEFQLPVTQVILVNQDAGELQFDPALFGAAPEGIADSLAASGMNSLGGYLTQILQSEGFADLMVVTLLEDADQARAAVDNQEAGVVVILPANLSAALTVPAQTAEIEFYQDPALTIGPSIVKSVVQQLVDSFVGSGITLQVTFEQLEAAGQPLDEATLQAVVGSYLQQVRALPRGENPTNPLAIQTPTGETVTTNGSTGIVGIILVGMTVMYVFFTGASNAQTIISENDRGTLPRLFTTPTPQAAILGGKILAGILTITVQMVVLIGFGQLVFQIEWGRLATLTPVVGATVLAAACFGIFLISFVKTERQAGAMIGGGVTILGMIGMLPIFVASMPNPPQFVYTASKLVPQGWAVQGLQTSMQGGAPADVLGTSLVLLLWAAVFFGVGVMRFRSRFA
ncbi:MAG TPA: hypothetical protein DEH25_07475 [Chloroflexi bacterium]|nr:hypothetical protein [Chloroflexota bacterium]